MVGGARLAKRKRRKIAQNRGCFKRRRDSEGKKKNCRFSFDSYQGEILFEIFFPAIFKIERMTSRILRFVRDCQQPQEKMTEILPVQEIDLAEKMLKIDQDESFKK
ncbi:hypothetical protein NPIL_179931 [Nephila pilipes]|uniref:Uncharacterized protein n=1 Tax=Nephila pilipes TaxID=299642 RepID=A0A8X6TF03_NEPPI|nr:hypothetical protein NPIL_179931 [Nephila pilipes]